MNEWIFNGVSVNLQLSFALSNISGNNHSFRQKCVSPVNFNLTDPHCLILYWHVKKPKKIYQENPIFSWILLHFSVKEWRQPHQKNLVTSCLIFLLKSLRWKLKVHKYRFFSHLVIYFLDYTRILNNNFLLETCQVEMVLKYHLIPKYVIYYFSRIIFLNCILFAHFNLLL
jgi:hypothetical protein